MVGRTVSHYKIFQRLGEGGKGVVHPELKPENIMDQKDGSVKIVGPC